MNPIISAIPHRGALLAQRLFPLLPQALPLRALSSGLLLAVMLAAGLLVPVAQAQEAASSETPVAQKQLVNINTADAAVLSSALTGVGQARAEAIVRYREMYGPFESIEELMEVSGVGEATLARNRELITLE